MGMIHELPFVIGRALSLIGLVASIGIPSLMAGAWAGWKFRKTREPDEVREAREIRLACQAEMSSSSSRQVRAVRLFEAARVMDARADDLRRDAQSSRELGTEIVRGNLREPQTQEISLVEED